MRETPASSGRPSASSSGWRASRYSSRRISCQSRSRDRERWIPAQSLPAGSFEALRKGRIAHSSIRSVRRKLRLRTPLVGTAAGMHQHNSAAGLSADGRHGVVPCKAADVVDDFERRRRALRERWRLCRCRRRSPHAGRGLENSFDHRQKSRLFLFGAYGTLGGIAGMRAGARAFGAEIEQVGAFVEALHAAGDGGFGGLGKEPPSLKESGVMLTMPMTSVRAAEFEGASAQLPICDSASERSHRANVSAFLAELVPSFHYQVKRSMGCFPAI